MRRTVVMRLAAALILTMIFSASAFAQSANGSISGIVTDGSGGVVPGVTVTATNRATGAVRTAVSNETGSFTIAALPAGQYDVVSELSGFKSYRLSGATVNVGSALSLKIPMVVGLTESVTVTAEAPLVETARSQISAIVNEKMIENLPTNGRNFIDFVLTTPGVVKDVRAGDISFAGQRGTLNSLVVDGANNDNTFFGQSLGRTGSGRAPYQFSQDAVKEFQVNSNAYSAEYGRAGGAVINVITKSGTNQWHGTGFYFLRDKKYNANDYINKINNRVKGPYHFDQYGFSLGGPIVHDKHFFFTNYDGQRNSIPNLVVLGVPKGGYATDPDTQAGLVKIRALADSYTRGQNQDVFLLKTDSELSMKNHLSLRYNRQKFVGRNFESGGTTIAEQHSGDSLVNTDTFSGSLSSTITNSLFNEFRGQYAKDQEPGKANTTMPEAVINDGGVRILTIGRNFFSPRETTIKRNQIADTATFLFGNHTVKGGFDYNHDNILNFFPGNFSGSYTFNSIADFNNGKPSRFLQAFAGPGTTGPITHPNIKETAVFAQDEWHLTSSLTLNGGLRYDRQGIEQPKVRNPDAQLLAAGIDTKVVPIDDNNVGVRLGFAFNPAARPNTVIRGGYGTFYGRTPAIMIGTAHSNNGINVQTLTFTGASIPAYPTIFPSIPTGTAAGKPTIIVFDKDFHSPKVQQASAGIEQGLWNDFSVAVNYQYVKGEDLPRSTDINLGTPTLVPLQIVGGPIVMVKRFGTDRPFTNFGRIIQFQSSAHSKYNGLTLDLNKRFSNSWQARLAYTYSTVKDDKPDATAVVPGGDDFKFAEDPQNLRGDYTYGDNDVRHRVVLSGVWAPDYARGLQNGILRGIVGGWSFSGIASYQTGQPYTPAIVGDLNNDGNNSNDRAPGLKRNSFRLPNQFSLDPRLSKEIPLSRGLRLQLIAEAFNITNRSNVNGVRTTFYAFDATKKTLTPLTTFGSPTSSSGPRIVQLAAKILF
ncbi:MAG TPA: TonB-dependent receptor [Thermoanaerobaculia bacterium]|nr:TonB-dependent receptor [Thermoanaerobaculia bacterium]